MRELCDIFKLHGNEFKHATACLWLSDAGEQSGDTSTRRLSFAEAQLSLEDHLSCLSRHIQETHATVVAYLSSNSVDLFLSVIACSSRMVSALPVLLNTRWSVAEIVAVLEPAVAAESTILLFDKGMQEKALEIKTRMKAPLFCEPVPGFSGDRRAAWRQEEEPRKACFESLSGHESSGDDALIVFTSGTSGKAKGVRLSHRAILLQALAKCQAPCRYSSQTRLLATTVPFFHVGGLSSILAAWMAGGSIILPYHRRDSIQAGFDPALVFRTLSVAPSMATNTLVVVPAMLHALETQHQRELFNVSFPAVRLVLVGGQSASPNNLLFVARAFPNAQVIQTFACTEAASSLTFIDVKDLPSCPLPGNLSGDCVGYPPSHIDLSIVSGKKAVIEPFQIGRVAFRSPCRMSGYWNRSQNDAPLRSENWFVTNDLGFWDKEGRLYFAGRNTDSIRTGGETVFAADVERVVARHALVGECAVFGLADDRFGETVCCAIVSRITRPSLKDIRAFCEVQGLAKYKCPTRLFYLDELPRNSSGKVLKFKLVELFRDCSPSRSKL